jgi:hypothetical protein
MDHTWWDARGSHTQTFAEKPQDVREQAEETLKGLADRLRTDNDLEYYDSSNVSITSVDLVQTAADVLVFEVAFYPDIKEQVVTDLLDRLIATNPNQNGK